MPPRMANPSLIVPGALPPLLELTRVIGTVGLPERTLDLVRLRVSQINGRSIDFSTGRGDGGKEFDDRLPQVEDWRQAEVFDGAERSALALAEATTRLDDRADPVPDEVWDAAAGHYDQQQLGALVMQIALVNLWNRVNVATAQTPGDWN